ncbi:MAG: D-alanyl-D-alanine carboxypeptidase/D-alanyl-D-alanine-endopeptidase [Flavobacteriales bacterium]|nr:D-alanyl-D-alanine carboxypeptidase/D-alanyl-D-alanine-endopeptidase [Flavobacteriales bacterium]|tara:strand:- start:19580 stop:21016 length:1437 start_codon:yes stop_codon:yes gene_type:complete
MKSFLTSITLLSFLFLSGQSPTNKIFTEFLQHKALKNASIGFYAYDLTDNNVIINHNGDLALIPASSLKLITTATALEILGENHRFTTTISYSGKIENGVLNGDIIIKGGGDPSLGSHRYRSYYGNFMNNWAAEIKKLGIDSINGKIIADASIFDNEIPPTWIWQDLGNYFGAGANGLSIYENFYSLALSSKNETQKTTINQINPHIPFLSIDNNVLGTSTNKDLSFIYGGPFQYNRYISGEIPKNRSEFKVKGSIPDPAYLCAYELDSILKISGIKMAYQPTTKRLLGDSCIENTTIKITSTQSPTLASLIQQTNLYSVNLYAEHLLNHIGLTIKKEGSTTAGAEALISFWKEKGIDTDGMYVYDGSGLSRFNTITTKQLVVILNKMDKSSNKDVFYNSLAISGKSGTLSSIANGTAGEGKIYGKSGYMTNVRSYSGYVITNNNKKIAFAIIVNNYNCSAYEMKKMLEKIMINLVNE